MIAVGSEGCFFCNAVDDVLTEFYPSPLEEGRSPGARISARFRVTCCVIEINHIWTLRASATDIFINPPPPGRQRTNEKQRSAHTMDIITLLKLLSTRTPGWHRASGGFEGQAREDYSCKAHPCQREREEIHRCAAYWKDRQYLKEEDKALAKQPDKPFSRAGVDEDSGVWFRM